MTDTIDISTWKEFAFSDIFEIRKGFYNKKPEQLDKGDIPFLGATDSNNGVTGWYTLDEIQTSTKTGAGPNSPLTSKLFPGNAVCVTNNGSVGHAYFQPRQFTCSHDVNPLYRRDGAFNVYTGLFVASVIMHDKYRWQYGRKWRPARMINSKMRLPATASGDPDWQFMEDFIKSLNHKPLTTENPAPSSRTADLNLDNWAWFSLGGPNGLFDIKKGKRLTSADQTDGSTPYIGAIDSNNGVSNRIGQSAIHDGNTISLSYNGSVGEAFYQPDPYWSTDDVNALYLRSEYGELTPATGLFISTVLRQEKYRFSYGRKWTLDNMNATSIRLPIAPDGNPDWQFMEDYIRLLPYGDRIPEVGD